MCETQRKARSFVPRGRRTGYRRAPAGPSLDRQIFGRPGEGLPFHDVSEPSRMTALVARWRHRHEHDPVLVTTLAEIDALIHTLLDEPTGRIAVELRFDATVRDDARRMLVGIHGGELVGGIALAMGEDPAGLWYSQGQPNPDRGRGSYPGMGAPRWFPADCRMSIHEGSCA